MVDERSLEYEGNKTQEQATCLVRGHKITSSIGSRRGRRSRSGSHGPGVLGGSGGGYGGSVCPSRGCRYKKIIKLAFIRHIY